jgi:hypothetical protein
MKLALIAAIILLAGCAAAPPYRSAPYDSGTTNSETKSANTFNRDAYDCEREAALSGAGSKAEAFNSCMRSRGHTPKR